MSHAISNNEAFFKHLLHEYQQALYWHIRHIVGCHEDAEDALQETFLRAYRHLDKLREESSEKSWLYRIATNESLRLLENRRTTDDVADYHPVQDETPDYDNLQQALVTATNRLPPRQRAVFCMRYYDELSYEDIAFATDSNVKAVTANFHHAKERIRQFLLAIC